MRKHTGSIPVNTFGDETSTGISIDRISFDSLPPLGEWQQPERHDRHSFFLLENGSVTMEIDFQRYRIRSPSIIYMHPDQVHRIIGFKAVTVCAWAIDNENLSPSYLRLLEQINPAAPARLDKKDFDLLSEAASLCIKIANRKKGQLYHSVLKDYANALAGTVISHFLQRSAPADKLTRAESVTKAFRDSLSKQFLTFKRPADYARQLHLSTPYLNECVKNITGQPVSYHIQQRVILEARRLLYHSGQSLKEIASALGYDDYPYFSRLFTKVAGMAPQTFRNKNHD